MSQQDAFFLSSRGVRNACFDVGDKPSGGMRGLGLARPLSRTQLVLSCLFLHTISGCSAIAYAFLLSWILTARPAEWEGVQSATVLLL